MALTRTNLEDRCLQYGYGEGDRTRFQDFLNQRYRDVLARHRWSWNQTVSAIVLNAAANSITVNTTTYIFWGRLRPTQIDVLEPEYIDWNSPKSYEFTRAAFDSSNRGMPTKYTITGNTVYFNLFADRAYNYDAQLYALPAYLTTGATEPILPDEDREVLVYGALMDQCLRDKDYNGAQMWNQMYEGRITEMWAKDRMNNEESDRKVRMPDHYHGTFDY